MSLKERRAKLPVTLMVDTFAGISYMNGVSVQVMFIVSVGVTVFPSSVSFDGVEDDGSEDVFSESVRSSHPQKNPKIREREII